MGAFNRRHPWGGFCQWSGRVGGFPGNLGGKRQRRVCIEKGVTSVEAAVHVVFVEYSILQHKEKKDGKLYL